MVAEKVSVVSNMLVMVSVMLTCPVSVVLSTLVAVWIISEVEVVGIMLMEDVTSIEVSTVSTVRVFVLPENVWVV